MARHKNAQWNLNEKVQSYEELNAAVLMDIRDELQTLNRLLACPNFVGMPQVLKQIRRNTANLPKVKK